MREWAAECQKAETRIVRRRYPATEDLYRCFHERVLRRCSRHCTLCNVLNRQITIAPTNSGDNELEDQLVNRFVRARAGGKSDLLQGGRPRRTLRGMGTAASFLGRTPASFRSLRFNQASTTSASQR